MKFELVNHKKGTKKKSKEECKAFSPQVSLPAAHNYVPDNQVFKMTQSVEILSLLTGSTTLPTFAASYFYIGAVDQVSSLSAVFDQYRIDEIETWIVPRLTSQASASFNNGLLTSVVDYDDANALTTVASALDYTNALTTSGLMGHYRRFKPHVAEALYGGAFTSYGNVASPWIDFASTGVQHYGLKLAFTVCGSASMVFDMIYRLHFSCRNIR